MENMPALISMHRSSHVDAEAWEANGVGAAGLLQYRRCVVGLARQP